MNVIFDLYQRTSVTESRGRPEEGRDEVSRLRAQVDDLKRRADGLTLACQAMWELLRQHAQLSDSELIERMQEVDLRDGYADGRITSSSVACPGCGRKSRSTRRQCIYCGATLPGHSVFSK